MKTNSFIVLFHLQRLYKRRKADANGIMRSTFGSIMDPVDYKSTTSNRPGSGDSDYEDILNNYDKDRDGIIDESETSHGIQMIQF